MHTASQLVIKQGDKFLQKMEHPSSPTSGVLPPADCFKLQFEDATRELMVELTCRYTKDFSLRAKLTNIPQFHQLQHYQPILGYLFEHGNFY